MCIENLMKNFRVTADSGGVFEVQAACPMDCLIYMNEKGQKPDTIKKMERRVDHGEWTGIPDGLLRYLKKRVKKMLSNE